MFTESGRIILSVITVLGLIFSTVMGMYSSVNAATSKDRMLFGVMGCLSFISFIFIVNLI